MDLGNWGFHRWPFDRRQTRTTSNIADSHEEAFARLMFLVDERRRCGMLTGGAGVGKTCLLGRLRTYAERLGRLCVEIDATALEPSEFVSQLGVRMFADTVAETSTSINWLKIQERMEALSLVKQPVVVLVDHFDLVEFGCGQALRRLMHLADASGTDLTVIIAANQRFTAPSLLDSVELLIELSPWTPEETSQFIATATRHAGAEYPVFTDDAVDAIHQLTRGVAADVVWLCDLSLLATIACDANKVDREIVESAATELSPRQRTLPLEIADSIAASA